MSRSLTTLEFSAMVQKYQSLVYTVCHQLVPDVGDAQDLTQETFLAALRPTKPRITYAAHGCAG